MRVDTDLDEEGEQPANVSIPAVQQDQLEVDNSADSIEQQDPNESLKDSLSNHPAHHEHSAHMP